MAASFQPARRLIKYAAPTVWHVFTPLAKETGAVNLGQGFPGWTPPEFVKQALSAATKETLEPESGFMMHQYARAAGHMSLVSAIAEDYAPRFNRAVDPATEVLVTNGATGALYCAISGLLNEGDEMVVFEPAFDIYAPAAEMVGAVVRPVPLRYSSREGGTKGWGFDLDELKSAFTPKTRVVLLNTPHNPTGKVFSPVELEQIAALVRAHPYSLAVSDEVYEHLLYKGHKHTSLATLPGMWDRTLTISSAGKTFSITGWKIGWIVGPAHLVRAAAIVQQWVCFSISTPQQAAVASCLREARKPYKGYPTYYDWLRAFYAEKRDIMAEALEDAGLKPMRPEGTFFMMGDTSEIQIPPGKEEAGIPYDWAFCKWLCRDIGVASIPPSSFYCEENQHLAKNYARFAYCKPNEELREAQTRLARLKAHRQAVSKL
mmetsp:Transcript_24949/g.27611  ORF Transcript_24949/g.27611 Transcript_24949/m.27611 type:complete len:432 (+) Transcript_24949:24-1319(+)